MSQIRVASPTLYTNQQLPPTNLYHMPYTKSPDVQKSSPLTRVYFNQDLTMRSRYAIPPSRPNRLNTPEKPPPAISMPKRVIALYSPADSTARIPGEWCSRTGCGGRGVAKLKEEAMGRYIGGYCTNLSFELRTTTITARESQ